MKLIRWAELYKNLNSEFGLNEQIQRELTNGNAQFIIDLSRSLQPPTGYSVPCLAIHIATVFFNKKSYVNYDRFMILAGALLLASKMKDVNCRIRDFCSSFYNVISKVNRSNEPYNEAKMQLIKDQICVAESEILRTLEYSCDFQLPLEFVKKYCDMMVVERETRQKVFFTCRMLILDSYRTHACLLFNSLTIFMATFLIACRYENIVC
jgi:hypothetical protein